jgi:hypothetical protein
VREVFHVLNFFNFWIFGVSVIFRKIISNKPAYLFDQVLFVSLFFSLVRSSADIVVKVWRPFFGLDLLHGNW